MADKKNEKQNEAKKNDSKKKKRDPAQMHRQVQDSIQALPFAIADHEKNGRKGKAMLLRYVGTPILKVMNKFFNRSRYKGTEGAKLKQTEQIKRHLEQRQQAMKYVQGEMAKAQKSARKGKPK
ncbi:MAG: hypothetical protein JO040_01935 [Gemmatimonadetes bacterium]|nr:hypothetical protein [Gemmatimonadota bacterium]